MSVEYSTFESGEPPLSPGLNATVSCLSSPEMAVIVGAAGSSPAVVRVIALAAPVDVDAVSVELTARSAIAYCVPEVKPLMLRGDSVEAGLRAVHVVPPLVEYS